MAYLKKVRRVVIILTIVGFVLMAVGLFLKSGLMPPQEQTEGIDIAMIAATLGLVMLLAGLILPYLFFSCPKCHESALNATGWRLKIPQYCRGCGEKFTEDE